MARLYLGPYYRRAEDLDSHLDALKAAGIPEWPLGFEGRAEDRVIGPELRALTSGRTWTGYVPAGPERKRHSSNSSTWIIMSSSKAPVAC